MDSTYQLLHLWLVYPINRISPSISERSERINRRRSRRQGHGTWPRSELRERRWGSIAVPILYRRRNRRQGHGTWPRSELCERRGRHRRPYFFINYFSINWFHQTGYYTSFWAGFLSNNSKLPNHQNGEIIYPKEGSTSPKWNRPTAVENFYPQNGDFLFSVENSGSHNIYLPDLQTKAVLSPKTRTGQKQK